MKTRRILSVLLAAAMTCAMCLSVGAADVTPCRLRLGEGVHSQDRFGW